MFDHLFGLLLLGLGLQSPVSAPAVKGDDTVKVQDADSSGHQENENDQDESENEQENETKDDSSTHTTGTTGSAGESGKSRNTRESEQSKIIREKATAEKKREELKKRTQRAAESRSSLRDSLKLQLKEGKDVYRALFASHREEFEKEIETRHEEAQNEHTAKKQEMEKKLSEFADTRKKEKVETIQTKLGSLNEKLVAQATEKIGKISSILDSVILKKSQLTTIPAGGDVSAFNSAVTEAQSAILAAQDVLTAQSGKTYVVAVTSETAVKQDVASTLKSLNTDRKKLSDAIAGARKAVSVAIRELAKLRGESVPEAVIK